MRKIVTGYWKIIPFLFLISTVMISVGDVESQIVSHNKKLSHSAHSYCGNKFIIPLNYKY